MLAALDQLRFVDFFHRGVDFALVGLDTAVPVVFVGVVIFSAL